MSRRSSARFAALLSAVALTLGAAAVTSTVDSKGIVTAGACCSGHK